MATQEILFDYKVWRDDEGVFYQITKNGEDMLKPQSVRPEYLSVMDFTLSHGSIEKQTGAFLKKAHELAKLGIDNLIKYEKL